MTLLLDIIVWNLKVTLPVWIMLAINLIELN